MTTERNLEDRCLKHGIITDSFVRQSDCVSREVWDTLDKNFVKISIKMREREYFAFSTAQSFK